MSVHITFLGSGDAFGSGGRFQTCILVKGSKSQFLIDCGASALIAMRRFQVNPNDIAMILLSHLHGDHFGGLPFFILDAQFISKRPHPLLIAGPPGTQKRVPELMEVMFPGSTRVERKFSVDLIELELERPRALGEITVTPYEVRHPSGSPSLALRIECEGKTIAYSGDTEWTEALIPVAQDADLFIAESYAFDKKVKYHTDFQTLIAHLDDLRPKRMVITHMGPDMLARLGTLPCEHAADGIVIEL
ncbi:MAG: MBL fold metallo-hydrolase [Candidatus Methylomirabilales bacterium]